MRLKKYTKTFSANVNTLCPYCHRRGYRDHIFYGTSDGRRIKYHSYYCPRCRKYYTDFPGKVTPALKELISYLRDVLSGTEIAYFLKTHGIKVSPSLVWTIPAKNEAVKIYRVEIKHWKYRIEYSRKLFSKASRIHQERTETEG